MNRRAGGFSLIEVLVTMMILGVGLLGLAGLQARALTAEVESFSRSQAIILANDMADRIATNRGDAKLGAGSAYASTTVYGSPYTPGTACATLSLAAKDICEWSELLKGASQTSGGNKLGQLSGARGCLAYAVAVPGSQPQRFIVTVAWQGRGGLGAVPSDLTCGSGAILPESNRRAVSVTVPLADLDG